VKPIRQTVITREHIREDLATGETKRAVTVAFIRGDVAILREGQVAEAMAAEIALATEEGRLTQLVTAVLDGAERNQGAAR
jgi:hypothetical protein